MKTLKITIEDKEFEIKVNDVDLETLIKVIKAFDMK